MDKKQLGFLDVFCIASGTMLSAGLFVLPGIAFAKVGPALFLSYILACFISIPTIFCQAELVTAMPKAGGDYFYVSRSMGFALGTAGGLGSWLSLTLKSAFALIGIAAYLDLVMPLPIKPLATTLCVFFIVLNLIGIKQAARIQRFLVSIILVFLTFYICWGFLHVHIERYTPFYPFGYRSIFSTAGLVFISFAGLTKVASIAEEIKEPHRSIPLGMFLSLIVIGIVYALTVFVTTGLGDQKGLQASLTPLVDGAGAFAGTAGRIVMAITALLALISATNAGIISASQYPMAMSRDGVLPKFISKVNKRFSTYHFSIILTGLFMLLAILFLELELLVKVASGLFLLVCISINLAVIIMRESRLQNYQPKFRSPLYPAMPTLGIIGCGFLFLQMGPLILSLSCLFIAGCLVWYLLYAGVEEIRESALIHVIERVLNKELAVGDLSRELKEIIKERDDITEDRFDHIIKDSQVLDIGETLKMEELFEKVSSNLSQELGVEATRLKELFLKREKESSTVIGKGLAIPHIIIEGKNKFNILLVRSKKGIAFPRSGAVHTVFALVGSKDERNFYLRALSAIAQICQQKDFEKKWIRARNIEELKDIILLAERRRFEEVYHVDKRRTAGTN